MDLDKICHLDALYIKRASFVSTRKKSLSGPHFCCPSALPAITKKCSEIGDHFAFCFEGNVILQ